LEPLLLFVGFRLVAGLVPGKVQTPLEHSPEAQDALLTQGEPPIKLVPLVLPPLPQSAVSLANCGRAQHSFTVLLFPRQSLKLLYVAKTILAVTIKPKTATNTA
jgi:hypothetical protein